ncbi:hypothetical protein [Streptomyces sp. enrichment culture]|uniref:hypothetical protein n=1 Tax=Streptomyces sp. enrichment culture TaxID=1795815 RepID=UPI003F57FAEE
MPRPGGPRTVTDEQVAAVVTKTLESTPRNATHWSTRAVAKETGLSQSTVSRIRRAFGLQPHRTAPRRLGCRRIRTSSTRSMSPRRGTRAGRSRDRQREIVRQRWTSEFARTSSARSRKVA